MSRDPNAPRPDESPDLEAEREVDLGRYGWAILHRWWLVVLAAVVGGVIGYLVSLGGGTLFQARATVYPGQPLTPSSNAQIQSLQTNPSTISQVVKSESAVRAVAAELDIDPGALRRGISTKTVAGAVARSGQSQLVEVVVRGPWRRQSAEAANALARRAVDRISEYPDAKIAQLEAQLEGLNGQLEALDAAIERYRAASEAADLSSTDRLVLVGLLADAQQDRGQLVTQETQTELALALARDVERASVVTQATATKVAAKSRRSSIVVGAVVGLVVGLGLALAWEPVRRRLRRV